MLSELQQKLNYVSGYRENRQKTAQFILNNSDYFEELLALSFEATNKDSYKASWTLEFVAYEKLDWFAPYLDFLSSNLKLLNDESSIRPLAKITQLLVKAHFSNEDSIIILSEDNLQNIIETSFDWLISDTKVATKAYSIRTLYTIGNYYDWIHPELKQIITKDYANHSSAYKAVAREILKKLEHKK